jgi:hypothetical protein
VSPRSLILSLEDDVAQLGQMVAQLGQEVNLLRERVQDMGDALTAAASGELAPAEAFAAAGALGMRDLEPGAAVISVEARNVDPHSEQGMFQITHQFRMPRNTGHVLVRRLYVEPHLAPYFRLVGVYEDSYLLLIGSGSPLGETVPCELFTSSYGSPRFDWKFGQGDTIAFRIANVSARKLHFRLLMLGCWMEGPKPE